MALVNVASSLHTAIRIWDAAGQSYVVIGARDPHSPEIVGWGITYDVDEDGFNQWVAANPDAAPFLRIVTQEEIDYLSDPANTHGFEVGLTQPGQPEGPPQPPVNVDTPYVSQSGDVLSCTMGNWENDPVSYSYTWQIAGILAGTDSNSYTVVPADYGKTAICLVVATNAGGSTDAPTSNAVVVTDPGGSPEPTPAILVGGAFNDAELATVVADIAAGGTAWQGFDIVVDGLAMRSVRQQFAGAASAADICTLINAQLGPYALTTLPGFAAPWAFMITSNTKGPASQLDYPTVPISISDADPMKRTEDISVMMRLTHVTGATITQGT
jgi:hypothetical protein